MVYNPSIFQVILAGIILYSIFRYMAMELITYYRKASEKPSKQRNDIQSRLKKANAKYYKSLK